MSIRFLSFAPGHAAIGRIVKATGSAEDSTSSAISIKRAGSESIAKHLKSQTIRFQIERLIALGRMVSVLAAES